MAYTKTNWNESTPITADKLNKIEDGIASALPLTGGTLTGNLRIEGNSKAMTIGTGPNDVYIANSSSGAFLQLKDDGLLRYNNNIVYHEGFKPAPWDIGALSLTGGTLTGNVYAPIFETSTDFIVNRHGFRTYYTNSPEGACIACEKNNSDIKLADNRMVYTNSNGNCEIGPQNSSHCHIYTNSPSFYFNKELIVNGRPVWHTGNFNPGTKLDAGAFTIHDRDLRVHGKRALVGFNTADGNYLSLNYDRDFAEGVRIHGLTKIESIETDGRLVFTKIGGGQLSANLVNLGLHANTGNGQMMTATENTIYVGNPQTTLVLESNRTLMVNIGGAEQRILTDRDSCARFSWNGSRISIDGGGNNAAVSLADTSETTRALYNWHGGGDFRLRTAGGLGPLDGYITMTW